MEHDQQDKPSSFFTIIKDQNTNRMKVPQKIVMCLDEGLWRKAFIFLIGPCGEKWKVSILKEGNELYMQNGWKKFMKDNSVVHDEFLLFTYGEKRFQVQIFGKNGIERPCVKKEQVQEEQKVAPIVAKKKRGRPRKIHIPAARPGPK